MSFYKKLIFAFTVNILFASFAMAASSSFPHGCEVSGFGYNENYLVLNERGEQAFYLIQNRSNKLIELEHHETRPVFMSPKLHTKLGPQQWAAFASDVQNQYFKCFTQEDDNTAMINCADALEVCQYPRVKFALSNMGTYWISTNKEQGLVIKDAAAKGIFLHW